MNRRICFLAVHRFQAFYRDCFKRSACSLADLRRPTQPARTYHNANAEAGAGPETFSALVRVSNEGMPDSFSPKYWAARVGVIRVYPGLGNFRDKLCDASWLPASGPHGTACHIRADDPTTRNTVWDATSCHAWIPRRCVNGVDVWEAVLVQATDTREPEEGCQLNLLNELQI